MNSRLVALGLTVMFALLPGCRHSRVVQTDYERGTLFGLQRVTHDDGATEDTVGVCKEKLVYDTNKDGRWSIYMKSITGRDITLKSSSRSGDSEPTVTADCSRIAFVSSREGQQNIYVVSGEQASAALRIGPGGHPRFAPDGSSLYYDRFLITERLSTIWRYDFKTNQHSQLTVGFYPAPSPDGNTIAFSRRNLSTKTIALWVLDLRTQQENEVASLEKASLVRPVWSADGRYLLVSTTQKLRNEDGTVSVTDQAMPNTEIAIVGRDGTGFTILTDNPSPDVAMAWDAGGWVYFTSRREQTFDIWRFKPQLVETASR